MPPCFFDLSERTKFRVTGADRVRFLNGQTTNDVRKSNESATQESCVLNTKGHLEAHLFLFKSSDAIWIDADETLRESVLARLEKYVIADDVIIEDVTDEFALFHVVAESKPEMNPVIFCGRSRRLSHEGWDVWVELAASERAKSALAASYELKDESEWEVLRIENGIPRWGRELTPEIIPPEAGLEMRAIDYEKGCYIGQEVISRMKMTGQVRQRLCGLSSTEELTPGMELRAQSVAGGADPGSSEGADPGASSGGKSVGRITSATYSPRMGAHIALAMIKRGFTEPGTQLNAFFHGRAARVEVAPLPFPV